MGGGSPSNVVHPVIIHAQPRVDKAEAGARTVVRRYDQARLSSRPERTPEGYLFARAAVARTGVQSYRTQDGAEVLELRLPEDVFDAASIATLHGQPLTLGHPNDMVSAETVRSLRRGVVLDPRVAEDEGLLYADLRVEDAETIARVEDGVNELSSGYVCDLEPIEGGVWRKDGCKFDGTRADFVQRRIRHNHVALVKDGRANQGRADRPVAIRLDAAGHQITEDNMEMVEIEIGGQKIKVPQAVAEAIMGLQNEARELRMKLEDSSKPKDGADMGAMAQALKAKEAEVADMKAKMAGESARADAATIERGKMAVKLGESDAAKIAAEKAKAEAEAKAAEAQKRLDAAQRTPEQLVAERTEFARLLALGVAAGKAEKDLAALEMPALRKAVAVASGFRADASDEYYQAAVDSLVIKGQGDGIEALRGAPPVKKTDAQPAAPRVSPLVEAQRAVEKKLQHRA